MPGRPNLHEIRDETRIDFYKISLEADATGEIIYKQQGEKTMATQTTKNGGDGDDGKPKPNSEPKPQEDDKGSDIIGNGGKDDKGGHPITTGRR